jgi:four helix bundle protein
MTSHQPDQSMNGSTQDIKTFRDLKVYQVAFDMQRRVFRETKTWPKEETYTLVDQIRRSSRSIGANVAEAWAKRKYPAHLAKLTDSDGELQETSHGLGTAAACGYISSATTATLDMSCADIGRKLGAMMAKHEIFCLR